jgi:hypothetical protein
MNFHVLISACSCKLVLRYPRRSYQSENAVRLWCWLERLEQCDAQRVQHLLRKDN